MKCGKQVGTVWVILLCAFLVLTGSVPAARIALGEEELTPYETVGSYVTFGTYPQTAGGADSTPIEWLVLDYDAENDRALLISRYGLDAQPYNTEFRDITWENCTLRSWLNSTFLNKAFTEAEQDAILTTLVDNSSSQGYSGWSTSGGNDTQDKLFFLSCAEANTYFGVQHFSVFGSWDNKRSRVEPTEYAILQGAYADSAYATKEGKAAGWWWLRSPGEYQRVAAYVTLDGSLAGDFASDALGCVRPAIWIDLNSDIF